MARHGKKIDNWEFTFDGVKVEVQVYMRKGGRIELTSFTAICPKHEVEESDADINALRESVRKELHQKIAMTWERFILVTYCGHHSQPHTYEDQEPDEALDGEFEVQSHMNFQVIEVATRPDGRKMHRYLNRGYNSGNVISGAPKVGREEKNFHFDWKPTMSSLIPYSPENLAALEDLRSRFISLNKVLEQRLSPNNMQQTLEQIKQSGPMRLMQETTCA